MSDMLRMAKGLSVQPKNIVILGAKSESLLSWAVESSASKVLIIEPEKSLAERARLLVSEQKRSNSVIVEEGVPLSDNPQRDELPIFIGNLVGYTSSLMPSKIKKVRPALKFKEEVAKTVLLSDCMNKLGISECEPSLLITQLNGAESKCISPQVLTDFTHLLIQTSQPPLFGDESPLANVKTLLAQAERDFIVVPEFAPPFVMVVSTKSTDLTAAKEYYRQRNHHENNVDALVKENQELKISLKSLRVEVSDLKDSKKEVLLSESKLNKKAEEAKANLENLKVINHKLESELSKSIEIKDSLIKESESLKQGKDECDAELNNLIEQYSSDKLKWENYFEDSSNKIAEAKNSERKLMETLDITSKLNLKLSSDLEDLREKYRTKIKSEEELTLLINELYEKLRQASDFYLKLEKKYPEIADEKNI
ncbi:hypothetical protein OCL06_07530 [Alteromonas sp. ASW11-19]|uniref:SMC hinge domain-containing protein n=1 Tax=Alteromonas salexigens TaxID=2982530 RepID=A0ABT2VMX0_9ALTE|nr:hypothetical protein [Alteromonas salexigens]MCU7554445.1 hypothetical protein [Alteromonas salexigens]